MKYALSLFALIVILNFYGCKKSHPVEPPVDTIEEIKIGNQVWMLKNLNVDHYQNGDSIPEVRDYETWKNLKTGAWCYYNNDPAIGVIYGKLYNWYAVNDPRGLAIQGWHVPSDDEWTELVNYLGGSDVAGGKLKEIETTHWTSPNYGATNETGFSALPGGWRYYYGGTFNDIGFLGSWWSATEQEATIAWGCYLYANSANSNRIFCSKYFGYSVRCVKDGK